jgi:hypothetical protein
VQPAVLFNVQIQGRLDGSKQVLDELETEVYYEMANLFPKHTGLPFVVWVSVRGGSRHDVRVKVSLGPKVQLSELISVGIRPSVHLIGADETVISTCHFEMLTEWIELNREAIIKYWNEEIDTVDLVAAIRPLVRP